MRTNVHGVVVDVLVHLQPGHVLELLGTVRALERKVVTVRDLVLLEAPVYEQK